MTPKRKLKRRISNNFRRNSTRESHIYKKKQYIFFFQIQTFRTLAGEEGQLTHNFRPIQPLYDRIIYMNSFSDLLKVDRISLVIFATIALIYSHISK